jgi:pyrroloquinoline quinone biosynthesis protein D
MSDVDVHGILHSIPALAPMFRLQYETVQASWVLLYPEGMVRLNGPASEILQRCDGRRTVQQVVEELQQRFGESDLCHDVCEFMREAHGHGWIA